MTGVYVISGPAGIYVGEAADCFARASVKLAVQLGLAWGIVREMPGSTKQERLRAEIATADAWAALGFAIVSRNTSAGDLQTREKMRRAHIGRICPGETREKIRNSMRGKNYGKRHTEEVRERIAAAQRGRVRSPETRAKMAAAQRGVRRSHTPETRARISATMRQLRAEAREANG